MSYMCSCLIFWFDFYPTKIIVTLCLILKEQLYISCLSVYFEFHEVFPLFSNQEPHLSKQCYAQLIQHNKALAKIKQNWM